MTHLELAENFVTLLERERYRMGMTQRQMADKLGMSVSGYKKLALGGTNKIDLYNAYKVFSFNESSFLQLLGCPADQSDLIARLPSLSPIQLAAIKMIIAAEES